MDRRFDERIRRHPLCPGCRYDLVATVQANKRTCPECGRKFTLNELVRSPREGDWTPVEGLKRAAAAIFIRSLILLVAWAPAYFLIAKVLMLISVTGWVVVVIVLVLMFIPGLIIGKVIAKELAEIAGMTSVILTAMASLFAIGVAYGGPMLADAIMPTSFWLASLSGFIATGVALIFTIKDTLADT